MAAAPPDPIGAPVKLLIQPGAGVAALVKGIEKAQKSVEIIIFRFDRIEIERALANAVKRGLSVHALIAFTNHGGEKNLRKLEMRFLAAGITVARTSDDLARYHGKVMIVDRKELYLLAFNLTHLDIEHSRSFGIVTKNRKLVHEAVKLFECDTKRQNYQPGSTKFLVSPSNARKQLAAFIKGARKELLIYDLKITDREMIRALEERAEAGVQIRIIGKMNRKNSAVTVRKLERMRLHTRTMVRDRSEVFMGSQSLRALELDARREIGVIFRDQKIASSIVKTFEEDWRRTAAPRQEIAKTEPHTQVIKAAKKVAKTVTKELPPVGPIVEDVMQEVIPEDVDIELDSKEVDESVKDAVKDAVKEAVQGVMTEVVERKDAGDK
jgi:phosphatidylserine/phosphatidylglycerophosphate/cardiolipin synthase-like enzyme